MSASATGTALICASWHDVAINCTEGAPIECLSNEAIVAACDLFARGLGTITFTANRDAAVALRLIPQEDLS